jgi:PAS domain S-box-containing protein
MSVADIDTPESAALLAERTAEIVRLGSAVFQTTHRRRDGTTIPTEISSTAIDFEGRPAILSIARDVGDRRR